MPKPLIRWTIGGIRRLEGLNILAESVKQFKKIYPDCDFVICYNQMPEDNLTFLETPLYNQELYKHDLYAPNQETWKLYPPRLRIDAHELVVDNDLVILKKISEIDQFLNDDCTLLLRGSYRFYGKYDKIVPEGFCINSGIYGMPPHFDFEKLIKEKCSLDNTKKWVQNRNKGLFDDQGIISSCLLDYKKVLIIENSKIYNYDTYKSKNPPRASGYHFINSNRKYHVGWQKFLQHRFRPIHL